MIPLWNNHNTTVHYGISRREEISQTDFKCSYPITFPCLNSVSSQNLSRPFVNTDLMVGAWLNTPVATGLKISWLWLRSNNVLILVKTLSCFFMTLTLYQEIKLWYIYYKKSNLKIYVTLLNNIWHFRWNHCFYYIFFVRLLLFEVAGVYKWSAAQVQSK